MVEIAKTEKIGCSFVNRLLRLTKLALDIQKAILEGRQAKGLQLEELTQAMPSEWTVQRARSPRPYNIGCPPVTGTTAPEI